MPKNKKKTSEQNKTKAEKQIVKENNKSKEKSEEQIERIEKIKRTEEGVFKIESKSKSGTFHTVKEEYGQYSCDCTGFRFRRACRHIELVYIENQKNAEKEQNQTI